ncbi:hypothetical protein OM076_19815 [Solirubrobacter ginsenosidimutans]|uniref:Uncharacterized protein n=1 Tax=Solirubrobacter ginsenosidimutans TaxID=490573 RepID=A0A9X3MT29_9ACTN|nr:hypothetical protein [Solirubrobacter ginsenosidimutans]MDA0162531.1 hypothetical protein [Solirubrobacter ginsenosidimutans]
MRAASVAACSIIAVVAATATSARARGQDAPVKDAAPLVVSYVPPAGDPLGDRIRGRAWTYDSAVTAAGRAARGDLDGAGALLDAFQDLQRPDGALESSYDIASGAGAGPLRAGNQAWAGLAALEWRTRTCSGRHDRLIARLADWLLGQRMGDRDAGGFGLVVGGPDVTWVSTEHNLEARAFFAGLAATLDGRAADPATGRACQPGLDGLSASAARALSARSAEAAARIDRAIDAELFIRDSAARAHWRQGLDDDARPLDAQALGILWLLGRGRRADAVAVERYVDASMAVKGRSVDRPGADGQTFDGYRPFADAWGPDVLWMEGTLMMRLAKARLGRDVSALDGHVARWAALTAPGLPLQVDRAAGEDYHVWPAAAPAAWLALSHSRFALLM